MLIQHDVSSLESVSWLNNLISLQGSTKAEHHSLGESLFRGTMVTASSTHQPPGWGSGGLLSRNAQEVILPRMQIQGSSIICCLKMVVCWGGAGAGGQPAPLDSSVTRLSGP